MVKALRFFSAPIQLLATYQDRLEIFLKRSIAKVPEESRTFAEADVAGPILEKIKYLDIDTDLAEMFSNLLASSIDKTTRQNVQPSFSFVLNQLSPEEAIFLSKLFPHGINLKKREKTPPMPSRMKQLATILNVLEESLPSHLAHLSALGLLLLGYDHVGNKDRRIAVFNVKRIRRVGFTEYGLAFMSCCLRKEIPNQD